MRQRCGDSSGAISGCRLPALAAWLWFAIGASLAHAQTLSTILRESDRAAMTQALDVINLTTNDPGFLKDLAEPRWALQRVRHLLGAPLELPAWGDEVIAVAEAGGARAEFAAVGRWLELPPQENAAEMAGSSSPAIGADALDVTLLDALAEFSGAARRAQAQVEKALVTVSPAERAYAAAAVLGGTFLIDDHPELRPLFVAAGMPERELDAVIAEERLLNPEPGAARFLAVCQSVRVEGLLAAAMTLQEAIETLEIQCEKVAWPERVTVVATGGVCLVVGTPGADRFEEAATLILDPGGDDLYAGAAGQANGLVGQSVAAVLDLGGDDRYAGVGLLAPGAALFGVALVVDRAGSDAHRAEYAGAGLGLFGGARVEDAAGDDAYQAQALGQGAGFVGFGLFRDTSGNDRYDLGFCGQGYAGMRGVGLLMDADGNDRYAAGGVRVDYDRNEDRYLSEAQGFACGLRPYAGGGLAALVDLAGNDTYQADVYGQGVGYWYAVGMLIDRSGQDAYHLFQYGQGSGIHLSLGLLADGGGRDMYTGFTLCQGNAHDYAVGWLIDRDGDDTYTGDHFVQGRAINNSFAVLLDAAGADAYLARQSTMAQGLGDNGGDREYGSLALLLDLAGTDSYTCGATNGVLMERPDVGVIYDVAPVAEGVRP